jgi:tetratricopeptide (TPR) repeat protein
VEPKSYERISTQLSALLAEMVRTQEVAVEAWSPEVQPGGTIGRFTLVRELGRGGFGVVYEAMDADLNRTVALKVVKPGSRIAARGSHWLMREAEAVARLNHPNIVTLHDFGQGPTGPYLVFELLRGRSLAERCRTGPLPLDEVLDVGIAVSRALVHAHGAGVIHRDLTAANVHLAEDGGVKVLDFGLAHLFGRDGANDGGTPAYMAPEQWEGDRGDERTDLFAFGVILFQAFSGKFPYQVDKGWSEALEPGETPRLPRRSAPAPLRELVRSLIDREPERRPQNARAVRDTFLALKKARDGAGRRRVLWSAAAVTAAALATAGWLFLRHEPPPAEQVGAVMAAMENGAGEASLEALPGLLAAALEPSRRVRIVPESRLGYLSRQAGLGEPGKLDAERGKDLARIAGAAVLLVPSSWREDGAAAIGVRAVESETGKAMFQAGVTLRGPADLAKAVDQLSDRIRRELNERYEDRRIRRPVAEAVTASPEAARFYYQGVDCLARPVLARGSVTQCQGFFERALALDPTFPLAHYQLASLSFLPGDTGQWAQGHLQAALEASSRLPAREAALVRALSARVEGRRDEALRIYDQLLSANPEDPELLTALASLRFEQRDWSSATRYLEKLVAVQPEEEGPLLDLILALGRSNRSDSLRALVVDLERQGSRRARPLVQAYGWLGDHEAAIRVARKAVQELGDTQLDSLRYALLTAGEFKEAEEVGRRQLAIEPSRLTRYLVDGALAGQGRLTEALLWVGETETLTARGTSSSEGLLYRQAMIAAGTWKAERVWRYASLLQAIAPSRAAQLAVVFALLGDLPHADALAADLDRATPEGEQYEALRAWRQGDPGGALARLARAESQDPWPVIGLAPAYLMAEISAAGGDDIGTLAAVERFHRLPPDRIWRAWAYPRSLYLSAVAHRRLGQLDAARRELGRLLVLYARADPGVELLKQARALHVQLQRP